MREKTKNLVQQKESELYRGEEKGFIPSSLVRVWGIATIFIEILDDIAASLEDLAAQSKSDSDLEFSTRLYSIPDPKEPANG